MSGFWIIFLIPFGLIVGCFLSACIHHFTPRVSFFDPFFHWSQYTHTRRWWHLFFLLDFLIIREKCDFDQPPINCIYPIIKWLRTIIAIILFTKVDSMSAHVFYLFLIEGIVVGSGIDSCSHVIPNRLLMKLSVSGYIYNFFQSD